MRGGVRNRGPPSTGKTSMGTLILIMLSVMATFYTAGRLWEDAQMRSLVARLSEKKTQESGLRSVDDTFKMLDCKEQQKRVADLEMEIAAAKSEGYLGKHSASRNSSAYGGRLHSVIGIYTSFGNRARRDSIRRTWMPTGLQLKKLETEKGIIIRFVVGRSANKGDSSDRAIDEENNEMNDFLILENHVEGEDEVARKTKNYVTAAVETWDAEFYIKIDDDVFVNVEMLGAMLASHWDKPRVYVGCMKSGEVISEPNQRWYEPEFWKFGDQKSYFRHATGQTYGISRAVAQYIAINSPILHEFRNEDVTVGSWMIGLDVEHIDERRMCCAMSIDGAICATRAYEQDKISPTKLGREDHYCTVLGEGPNLSRKFHYWKNGHSGELPIEVGREDRCFTVLFGGPNLRLLFQSRQWTFGPSPPLTGSNAAIVEASAVHHTNATLFSSKLYLLRDFLKVLETLTSLSILEVCCLGGLDPRLEKFSRMWRLELLELSSLKSPQSFGNNLELEEVVLWDTNCLKLLESLGDSSSQTRLVPISRHYKLLMFQPENVLAPVRENPAKLVPNWSNIQLVSF